MEGRSRDISKDTCWFVPLAELDNSEGTRLQRAFSPLSPTDKLVEAGGAFTISLETFLVNKKDEDEKGGNDLLVKSQVRYGSEPPTEAINFFGMDVPAGQVKDNLEFEHVFGKENHSPKNRVWIEVSIIEVDKGLNDETAVLAELSQMNKQFGAVFPTLIPFAGPVSSAVLGLAKLAALQQQNQVVFNSQVDFYGLFSEGEAKLRCGAYILFNQPTEGVKYRLRGLHLEYFAVADRELPIKDDYVVIKVVPALVSSGDGQELRRNQQVATVLNHAESRDSLSDRVGQIETLKSLVTDALSFQDLRSFIGLKEMKEFGKPLSDPQLETFVELGSRLREVISSLKS